MDSDCAGAGKGLRLGASSVARGRVSIPMRDAREPGASQGRHEAIALQFPWILNVLLYFSAVIGMLKSGTGPVRREVGMRSGRFRDQCPDLPEGTSMAATYGVTAEVPNRTASAFRQLGRGGRAVKLGGPSRREHGRPSGTALVSGGMPVSPRGWRVLVGHRQTSSRHLECTDFPLKV
jgi:hypothetical protein